MKLRFGFALAVLCIMFASGQCLAQALTGGVVPIGATSDRGQWSTDLWLRNVGSVQVAQDVGFYNITLPNGSVQTVKTTVTLEPGETRLLRRVDLNFNSGLWILDIDPRLEASVFLQYGAGALKFECLAVSRALLKPGDAWELHRVAVDTSTATGTFPTVLNKSSSFARIEIRIQQPAKVNGAYPYVTEIYNAPPGVSQYAIHSQIPDGGSLLYCLQACGLGSGGNGPPVYVIAPTGPTDGGTQAMRYPEPPGS